MKYILCTLVAIFQLCANAQNFPVGEWIPVSKETSGWNAAALEEADAYAKSIGTSAYMVIHKGVLVHQMGDVSYVSNIHSARKSILNILYGMYADQCRFNLDSTIEELGITDIELDGVKGLMDVEKQATVLDLLKARSGVYHRSAYEDTGWLKTRPARGSVQHGEVFDYNNWDFNALGTIFNKHCGIDVFSAFEERIAKPLNLQDFSKFRHTRWVYERNLSEHPAYEIKLSTRDMARIGLLMLNKGNINDKQLLSFDWIIKSTKMYSPYPRWVTGMGYGMLWWVNGDMDSWWDKGEVGKYKPFYTAAGSYGQYILVYPRQDLVVAHKVDTSNNPQKANVDFPRFFTLEKRIEAAFPKKQ